jgi:hypothetical protein
MGAYFIYLGYALAQLVEALFYKQKVTVSIPD